MSRRDPNSLFAYEQVRDYDHAKELLQKEIEDHTQNYQHSTTRLTPNAT
jgi:hypothetical protein